MAYDKPFKPNPDSGTLNQSASKMGPKSPDYWGEIRVNLKDMTAINTEDGLAVIKLSGWKKIDKNGRTYLSLGVNRYVAENKAPKPVRQESDFQDEEIPF